jgi:hypothetical protein
MYTIGDQAVNFFGVELDIAGKKYVVPALSLGHLKQYKEEIARMRTTDEEADPYEIMVTAIPVIHAAMSRNYPLLEVAEVERVVDIYNYRPIIDEIFAVSNLVKRAKERAAGERTPVTEAAQSTTSGGTSSSAKL